MNTPAATMVAEWMSADTGVGPSMASGSHTCSGNWPLFPMAPQKRSSATRVTRPAAMPPPPTNRATSPKLNVPARMLRTRMPMRNPKSPTRVTTKAFLAALAAAGFWYQNPIRR